MFEIEKDLKDRIEFLDFKLKGGTTSISIMEWLNNFLDKDREDMLKLLLYMEYITADEIFALYDEILSNTKFNTFSDDCLFIFHPVGPYEKSGTAMVYYINKVIKKKKNNLKKNFKSNIKFASNTNEIIKSIIDYSECKEKKLVLFDDILGSGKTIGNYIEEIFEKKLCLKEIFDEVIVISLVSTYEAIQNITKRFSDISVLVGMKREKIFSNENLIFNSPEVRGRLRNKSYKYGSMLCSGKSKIEPLGFDNSQAMIAFAYGTPNNTLPIIWWNSKDWHALFPRETQGRIDKCRSERKIIARAIAAINLIGDKDFYSLKYHPDAEGKINKFQFDKSAILIWLYQGIDESIISQRLCLSIQDMDHLMTQLMDENYIDKSKKLTDSGKKYIVLAQDFLKEIKKENDKNLVFEETNYVPTTFRGIII